MRLRKLRCWKKVCFNVGNAPKDSGLKSYSGFALIHIGHRHIIFMKLSRHMQIIYADIIMVASEQLLEYCSKTQKSLNPFLSNVKFLLRLGHLQVLLISDVTHGTDSSRPFFRYEIWNGVTQYITLPSY